MKKQQFEMKEEHLKLLRSMCVGWSECEFGAPEINPKRPYGNSSVYQDMLEILGLKELRDGVYELELFGKAYLLKGENKRNIEFGEGKEDTRLKDALFQLHKETETALQIVLCVGKFESGLYEEDLYGNWRKIK